MSTQQERNRAHYAKKAEQRQFRKDFAPNAEEAVFIKRLWRGVFLGFLGVGALIYFLPAWVLGLGILVVIGLVTVVAIGAGVKQGRGE
jgi:hypothetical protein